MLIYKDFPDNTFCRINSKVLYYIHSYTNLVMDIRASALLPP